MRRRYRLTRRGKIIAVCLMIIAISGTMLLLQTAQDRRIARDNENYRRLRSATLAPVQTATPQPTPNDDTMRITIPTLPPPAEEYAMLLAINADFCGWLTAGSVDLPVVFREFDNETYLTTNFTGEKSIGGTLFVDGYNRLYPADTLTVIYGHNMNGGAMFGSLSRFLQPGYLKEHPIVKFDTIASAEKYIPFAVFTAPADQVDIRRFQPNVEEFNALADQCAALSAYDIGIDVRYGDQLLALVTCDGPDDDRLFLLCRALRPGESEADVIAAIGNIPE